MNFFFETGRTTRFVNQVPVQSVKNNAPFPLLVPVIHRPDANKQLGRLRITPASLYWQQYAKRTIERADVSAGFYSFPQKYIVGLSQDAEPMDK